MNNSRYSTRRYNVELYIISECKFLKKNFNLKGRSCSELIFVHGQCVFAQSLSEGPGAQDEKRDT